MRGRILVIDHRTPRPDQDSGSASTFAYLQILAGAGFDVTFAPANLERAGRYSRALRRLGIRILAAPIWRSLDQVIRHVAPRCDVLLLYRAGVASQVFALARRVAPEAKILFHPVDVHFLRMERQAALTGEPADAAAAQTMRGIELDLLGQADATIVVSTRELAILRELLPDAPIHRIPILREPPVARRSWIQWPRSRVDVPRQRDPERRRDVLFIGGYEHLPNVDAVQWFTREVWPLVRARGGPHRFIVAGSKVPPAITALAADDIEVRGYVADLAPLFGACRLSVAPLRYGGGIKGKIVSSLSYGVPVVASAIAAEGMELQHEENILVADTPRDFADQVVRLCEDDALWRRLSHNGHQAFIDKFSLAAGAPRLLAVLDELARR
jgi:glycosyltransferase involved in cell wall biosynthesis